MTKYIHRSSDIKDFPFQDYADLNATELEDVADRHNIKLFNSWMLPQMVAFFGSFKATKNSRGKYDPKLLGRDNLGSDPWKLGIWRVATKLRRSALVKVQNTPQYASYSALVPLVLSGLKKYQNIGYNQWDPENLDLMVDPALYEAMMCELPEELFPEDIIDARNIGLTVKSGDRTGQKNSPLSTWKLSGIKNTKLAGLPPLATTMLSQIWVAHPTLRSPYMVLNPENWDEMPEPLITADISPVEYKAANSGKIPWLVD